MCSLSEFFPFLHLIPSPPPSSICRTMTLSNRANQLTQLSMKRSTKIQKTNSRLSGALGDELTEGTCRGSIYAGLCPVIMPAQPYAPSAIMQGRPYARSAIMLHTASDFRRVSKGHLHQLKSQLLCFIEQQGGQRGTGRATGVSI